MTENLPKSYNLQAELARERNRAAAERTLMAWIRTCLTLISFGFGINSIVSAVLIAQGKSAQSPLLLSRVLGLAFIALGTYAMVQAVIEHRQELRYIQRAVNYLYRPRTSLGLRVAVGLIGIGIFAFTWILISVLA